MALETTKFVPNDLKTTIIKITSYENKNLQGTIENLYFENKVCFKSLTEFLFAVEALLDGMAYPHAATENRSFNQQKKMNIHFGEDVYKRQNPRLTYRRRRGQGFPCSQAFL